MSTFLNIRNTHLSIRFAIRCVVKDIKEKFAYESTELGTKFLSKIFCPIVASMFLKFLLKYSRQQLTYSTLSTFITRATALGF